MRTRLLGSFVVALVAAGLAWSQAPKPEPPAPAPVVLPALSPRVAAEAECCEPCPAAFPEEARDNPNFWISGEYLLWWIRDSRVPALAAGGGAPALPAAPLTPEAVAALHAPARLVLFDGSEVDNEERSGGRFSAGYWFGEEHDFGIEGSYFFLAARSVGIDAHRSDAADPTAVVGPTFPDPPPAGSDPPPEHGKGHGHKPHDDKGAGDDKHHGDRDPPVPPGGSKTTAVAAGGTVTSTYSGDAQAVLSSRLQGAELSGVANLGRERWYSVDLLGGFRFVELVEGLGVSEDGAYGVTAAGPGAVNPGVASTSVAVDLNRREQLTGENYFYGGQVGARAEFRARRVFVDLLGKVALGCVRQEVEVGGTTTTAATTTNTLPDGTTSTTATPPTAARGLLARPDNVGSYRRDCFAVVPEATARLGYEFTENIRASVGYTFLYVSDVVRPGDQIERGPFSLHGTGFWAQGVDAGLEFRY